MSDDLIQSFEELFRGREHAYGTETGGAERRPDISFRQAIHTHLYGEHAIGVYPMVPRVFDSPDSDEIAGWDVRWGCVDIDVKGDSHKTGFDHPSHAMIAADNLCNALRLFGVTGWIEVTRSGGFHVWVFAQDWVEAATMRRALLVACEVAAVPPSEVNPKSEGFDDPDTLGNYVRLPYPGALSEAPSSDPRGRRRIVLDQDGVELKLSTFVADAEESLARPTDLKNMADMYKPPKPPIEIGEVPEIDKAISNKLSGLAYVVATDPPLEGQDRSGRLWKLAHLCKDDGLSPEEACAVLAWADANHGQKYLGRPDADTRIQACVGKAYA